jgi:hypothetical membrane protein
VTSFARRPSIVSSVAAPVIFIGGMIVAQAVSPQFDPARQTISELAALDAPTAVFMTVVFVLTGLCHLVTGAFATGIAAPGRIALALGGLLSFGVAASPLPTAAGTSDLHRLFAGLGFLVFTFWPVLGLRRSRAYPWLVRPWGAALGTALLAVFSVWFLAVWSQPELGYVGVIERLCGVAQSLWPAVVVIALVVTERREVRHT